MHSPISSLCMLRTKRATKKKSIPDILSRSGYLLHHLRNRPVVMIIMPIIISTYLKSWLLISVYPPESSPPLARLQAPCMLLMLLIFSPHCCIEIKFHHCALQILHLPQPRQGDRVAPSYFIHTHTFISRKLRPVCLSPQISTPCWCQESQAECVCVCV